MSRAYTDSGKRRSSQTHSRQSHLCDICGATPSGNGGNVAHGRAHVRRGEAVEVVRAQLYSSSPSRHFLATDDTETIAKFEAMGFEVRR